MVEEKKDDIGSEFQTRYEKWKERIGAMPPYSKTTAYTQIPEYRQIILLGRDALPYILDKIERDHEMDFVLCDAVIEICGWSPEEFATTDVGARRDAVVEKYREMDLGPEK